MLKKLSLKGVGPAPEMEVEFAERLTVITGDNGLGKSFILDAVWFGISQVYFLEEITPSLTGQSEINIKHKNGLDYDLTFSREIQDWSFNSFHKKNESKEFFPVPIIYQGSAGDFGVFDPVRYPNNPPYASMYAEEELRDGTDGRVLRDGHIRRNNNFNRSQLIKIPCNGMVNDIANWYREDSVNIRNMTKAIKILSDDNENPIEISAPKRISLNDSREIPHLITSGGIVPITIASAGVRRIISLAYAIVWAWHEHKIAADLTGIKPSRGLLLMIDEIETHLHPKWQRKILAAVLEVAKAITEDEGFQVQVICTTHSPIVLTGIEPHFDPEKDKLLDLQLTPGAPGERGTVELREVDWYKRGTVGNWLTSDMFNVSERSPEAQKAMDAAGQFGDPDFSGEPDPARLKQVDADLRAYLPDTDRFLVRWEYLLEQRGWMRHLES
jgi:hypothetical protein